MLLFLLGVAVGCVLGAGAVWLGVRAAVRRLREAHEVFLAARPPSP